MTAHRGRQRTFWLATEAATVAQLQELDLSLFDRVTGKPVLWPLQGQPPRTPRSASRSCTSG